MSSTDATDPADSAAHGADSAADDVGLLSPGWAGSAVAARTGDAAFLDALLDAETALVRAQAELGLAPARAVAVITAAAAGCRDPRALARRARAGGNPVIPLVADLAAAAGPDAAPFVHRGATSQDIIDTAMMLVAVRALEPILADLDRTVRALTALAAAHRDTPMAGRTLTQHAVPTTFGLKAAGWRSLVLGARARLAAVRGALPAQLGGAAGTLAAFEAFGPLTLGACSGASGASGASRAFRPLTLGASSGASRASEAPGPSGAYGAYGAPRAIGASRASRAFGGTDAADGRDLDHGTSRRDAQGEHDRTDDDGHDGPEAGVGIGPRLLAAYARQTGLAEPVLPWHTLRAPVADLAAALAFTAGALGKLAADVLVLSRTEIGELSEGSGGGSSAMPHKANPVRATLVAAAARQVPALASVLLGALVAEDERPAGAWHAEWQPLRETLRLVGGAARDAAELTADLTVHRDRMRDNLDLTGGLIVSERLAAALSALTDRGTAAQALTRATRRAAEEGLDLADALAAEPALVGLLPPERLRRLTDPTRYPGGAGALVDRALREQP